MSSRKVVKVDDIKNDAESITCAVEKSLYYINAFLAEPMCGRCFPCSMGSYEMRIILNDLIDGNGAEESVSRIRKIAEEMTVSSLCKKGKDTGKFILEWLDADVFNKHAQGICPAKTCKSLIAYRIEIERCDMCGECLKACKYGAIHGEKAKPFKSGYQPFEIRQHACVRCGECIKVCPTKAIILVDAQALEPAAV